MAAFDGSTATAETVVSERLATRLHDAPPSIDLSTPRLVAARIVEGEVGLMASQEAVVPFVPVSSADRDAAPSVLLNIVDTPPAYSVALSPGTTAIENTRSLRPLLACVQ